MIQERVEASRAISTTIDPATTAFIILSFEGPDPYTRRGRLATTVDGLCASLIDRGFSTTLIFPGDVTRPAEETDETGRLHLVRWGQWVSRYYPGGPYEGLETRVRDFTDGVALYITDLLTRSPHGPRLVIIGHEWQTAGVLQRLHRDLVYRGQRDRVLMLWMMRHALNILHTDLRTLNESCTIVTVSRFLKHELWKHGVDPLVLPAGLTAAAFAKPRTAVVDQWRTAGVGRTLLWKPGIWDGGMGSERLLLALADLKTRGDRPLLILENDLPLAHAERAATLNLYVHGETALVQPAAVDRVTPTVDIVALDRHLDAEERAALARAAITTLVLGEDDPTGIAVLEEMAHGGVVMTDSSMCDALIPAINSLPLETGEVAEMVSAIRDVAAHPDRADAIRRHARQTAEAYSWDHVLDNLLAKLEFLSLKH